MMKKLRSRRGETLVETLVSLLIVVLCLSFLATAIVTAARINAAAIGSLGIRTATVSNPPVVP